MFTLTARTGTPRRRTHASDKGKYEFLNSLSGAGERLELVSANLLQPESFEEVVRGCEIGASATLHPLCGEDGKYALKVHVYRRSRAAALTRWRLRNRPQRATSSIAMAAVVGGAKVLQTAF